MTRFSADIVPAAGEIATLTESASEFLLAAGVDARAVHHVALVIEEILTNVATHGGNADAKVSIVLDIAADGVFGEIGDWGQPFDPRAAAAVDLDAPVEDRKIGGLGLHLVRKLTSSLDYRRDGQQNWTTFCIPRGHTATEQG